MKTLNRIVKQNAQKFNVPGSVQAVIPIRTVWADGIFLVGKNKYAKSYKFTDINYTSASFDEKNRMLDQYGALINTFDCGATTKLTVAIRRRNMEDVRREVLIPLAGDERDVYRKEYNALLLGQAKGTNGMVRELYLTISAEKKSIGEAVNYFHRIEQNLNAQLRLLGSKCRAVEAVEKLQVLHSFYHGKSEENYPFSIEKSARLGHSFKDYIAPDEFRFERDCFHMGDQVGRVLFLKEYSSFLKDDMVTKFADINQNMMISIDMIPIPADEATRDIEKTLLGIETNITNWQRRQNSNNNFSAEVPYSMELQRQVTKDTLAELMTNDQRLLITVLTIVHTAKTKEELDRDTEAITAIASGGLCQIATLKFQQMDGLNTALPIGVLHLEAFRTLLTSSLSGLVPFQTQEVMHPGGLPCGVNRISSNLILVDRAKLLNPAAFILGVPGSGKSMTAKQFISYLALATDDHILIYDPESEYERLVEEMGGVNLPIDGRGLVHLNAMDMDKNYGDTQPLIDKSQFILSLYERMAKDKYNITPVHRSILDRCVGKVYEEEKRSGIVPSFFVLRKILQEQEGEEARDLALMLELFTDGSLRFFSNPTNVDIHKRIVNFSTRDMSENMRDIGQLIITDHMLNRVAGNWEKGIRTHIFLDEYHTLLKYEHSTEFLDSAYRRFRKRNAWVTSLTQNVESVLGSLSSRTMLSNSELIVMLSQAANDREELAKLLKISKEQMAYVTDREPGCGLLRVGSALIPHSNRMNKGKLYQLMSTRPGEF